MSGEGTFDRSKGIGRTTNNRWKRRHINPTVGLTRWVHQQRRLPSLCKFLSFRLSNEDTSQVTLNSPVYVISRIKRAGGRRDWRLVFKTSWDVVLISNPLIINWDGETSCRGFLDIFAFCNIVSQMIKMLTKAVVVISCILPVTLASILNTTSLVSCSSNWHCPSNETHVCVHGFCYPTKRFGEECLFDDQCQRSSLVCDLHGVCACIEEFRWLRGRCVPLLHCDYDHDCYWYHQCTDISLGIRGCRQVFLTTRQILLISGSIVCFVIAFGFLVCVARIRYHNRHRQVNQPVESRLPPHTHLTSYQAVSGVKKHDPCPGYGTWK